MEVKLILEDLQHCGGGGGGGIGDLIVDLIGIL